MNEKNELRPFVLLENADEVADILGGSAERDTYIGIDCSGIACSQCKAGCKSTPKESACHTDCHDSCRDGCQNGCKNSCYGGQK